MTRENNFDMIRLCAALTVLYAHAYLLYNVTSPQWLGWLNSGALGVVIFFVTSGYLITGSYLRNQDNLVKYGIARLLRIYPGLLAQYIVVILVIGALGSDLSAMDYWRSLSVSAASLLGYSISNIPTTFEHVANQGYAHEMNGNLWTLLQEVRMYLIIPFVLRFRMLTPALMGYGLWLLGYQGGEPHNIHELGLVYCWAFLVGSAFYVYRDEIKIDGAVAALCAVGAVISGNAFVSILCVAYAVMWFALRARPVKIAKYGDLSYGIYIYGFPVQQLFSSWFPDNLVMYVGGSLICTVALAAFSWKFVEKPALALKDRILVGISHERGSACITV